MAVKIDPNEYLRADDLMRNGTPCDISEEVRRGIEVERLVGIYSADGVLRIFPHVTKEYGFTRDSLVQMELRCVEREGSLVEQLTGVAELMGQVVCAES
jgi:hypothetical protein